MSGVVVGVGIDVADPARFDRLAERGAGRVWSHWYTEGEAEACLRSPRPGLAAALRFAIKEATYKSVGATFSGAVRWRDIEVAGRSSAWRVAVHGEVAALASAARVERFHVSTSQLGGVVMAVVLAEGSATGPVGTGPLT